MQPRHTLLLLTAALLTGCGDRESPSPTSGPAAASVAPTAAEPTTTESGAQAADTSAAPLSTTAAVDSPTYEAHLDYFGIGFHVVGRGEGSIGTVTITPTGLEGDNAPITRETEGPVELAEVGDLNVDGSPEIYVYTRSAGSGSYGGLIAYSANAKKSLSEIYLPPITNDPKASQGFMGHDEFRVVENTLVRRFPVYREGDTNAAPSGGTRQLQYKLEAGEAGWVLKVDKVVDQPELLTFDGTAQHIPVTARYPDVLDVGAMGSGEGVGVHFSFKHGDDALADAELHVFLPAGSTTVEELLPFVTGHGGLMENNGWAEVRRAPAGSGRFTQDWAQTVIDFTAGNGLSGHVVLGQTDAQAVQVTLLYPDALADTFWSAMTPVLDSLAFPMPSRSADAGTTPNPADSRLAGTAWTLVEIASMDDSIYRPAEGARYELVFQMGGRLVVQADCNRGLGSWRETPPSGLELGQIATTRMACPPDSIDARFLADLGYVRSFVSNDGHLFLATMADGSILEFAPLDDTSAAD